MAAKRMMGLGDYNHFCSFKVMQWWSPSFHSFFLPHMLIDQLAKQKGPLNRFRQSQKYESDQILPIQYCCCKTNYLLKHKFSVNQTCFCPNRNILYIHFANFVFFLDEPNFVVFLNVPKHFL